MPEPTKSMKRPLLVIALLVAIAVLALTRSRGPDPDTRFPSYSDQSFVIKHTSFVATFQAPRGSEDAPAQLRVGPDLHLMVNEDMAKVWTRQNGQWKPENHFPIPDGQIKIARREGQIFLYFDDSSFGPLPSQGSMEIAIHSPESDPQPRIQKVLPFTQADDFMRTRFEDNTDWEIVSGEWTTDWNPSAKAAPNAFRCQAKGMGLLLTGHDFWHDYDLAVSLNVPLDATAGLAFANYRVQIQEDKLEFFDEEGKRSSVSLLAPHGRWLRLAVRNRQGRRIEVSVDGVPVLSGPQGEFGRVGLVVAGSATFDDFHIATVQPEGLTPVASSSPAYGTKEEYGDGRDKELHRWARDADAWQVETVGEQQVASYSRLIYGSFEIEPAEGAVVLLRDMDGKVIAKHQGAMARNGCLILAGGQAIAESAARQGITVSVAGGEQAPVLRTASLHQEFFERAPVDWLQLSGNWHNTPRWQCDERWSFFGGVGHEAVLMVSKRRFEGNQSHEFYYGMKDLLGRKYKNMRYVRRDLNFSFCTDGRDPFSGYTLLYGGFANSASYLYAGRERLATNEKLKFPAFSTIYDLHLQWRRIRVEREAKRLRVRHDDDVIFDVEDPREKRPEGGHIMLWTQRNGVVYARMNSSAESIALGSEDHVLAPESAVPTAWQALSPLQVATRTEGEMTLARNRFAGGSFALEWPLPEPATSATLKLPVRIPQGVKLSVVLHCDDQAMLVPLTAPLSETYSLLGTLPASDYRRYVNPPLDLNGAPRESINETVEISLADLLGGRPLTRLVIGNCSQQDYLQFGLYGNHADAEFAVGEPIFE